MIKNITRRRALATVAASIAGTSLFAFDASSSGAAGDPKQFVDIFGGQLETIMNNNHSLPYEAKKKKILSLIDANVDIDGIAQYCLGRYWKTASSDQKKYYLKLFCSIVRYSVMSRLNNFNGVHYTIGNVQKQDDGTDVVYTTLSFPDKSPVNVGWTVGYRQEHPQIVDVVGGGASLRLTQRNDYVAFLRRNGGDVDILLNALSKQVARNEGRSQ